MKPTTLILFAASMSFAYGAVIMTDGLPNTPETPIKEVVQIENQPTIVLNSSQIDSEPLSTYSFHYPPNDPEDWTETICAKVEPFYDDLPPHLQAKFDRYCGGGAVPEPKATILAALALLILLRKKRS